MSDEEVRPQDVPEGSVTEDNLVSQQNPQEVEDDDDDNNEEEDRSA